MSQHFVTVCVVCVLCAAHAPCSAHADVQVGHLAVARDLQDMEDTVWLDERLQPLKRDIVSKEIVRVKERERQAQALGPHRLESEAVGRARVRRKRNPHVEESYFTKRIFQAFGDGERLDLDGFERLLKKLGLLEIITHLDDREDSVLSGKEQFGRLDNDKDSNKSAGQKEGGTLGGKSKQRCLGSEELLRSFSHDSLHPSENDNSTILPGWLLERVCPALVYQLATSDRTGCIQVPENWNAASVHIVEEEILTNNKLQVWIYSSISILIISLCGLLGVVVIPVMNKTYYHQLIQFLVALAVGTLCGDALIHLLPHAMMSSMEHQHQHRPDSTAEAEHNHDLNMWKGLVAMLGLVLFFFTEKALTMIAEWRKSHQRRNKLPLRVKVMREPETAGNNSVGDKHCKHKYSSYPYCYGEITTETQDNHHHHHRHHHNNHQKPVAIEEEKPLTSNSNAVSKAAEEDVEKKQEEEWKADETIVNHTKKNCDSAEATGNEAESYTVIIREHETKHHGHTHSHGHVHSAPESMSSVAWMVIMGDGLHNFTDGMAIGAAFAANIPGGFSTAIAVLCHELPHELGDFAVLLKAGMSAKQAVFYNLLSSVLCLFGMFFGILLGDDPAATSWIFAAAAGMFIYIALVDMIPELTSSHSAEGGSQWQCILQALGLTTGLGIMLIIALYEHDLKHIFSN